MSDRPQGDRSDKDYYLTGWGYTLGTPEAEEAWASKCAMTARLAKKNGETFHMVMTDLAPYKSMIDGSMITSRSQHRSHLKQHGCVEVGNETKHLKPAKQTPPPGLKQELINQVNAKLRY